jgi:alkanesulfonate monooxygenase SsuD/methylene tetrahydromethanopterin reductase-like flavin-dependent oxidoreductase (luciferase family)
VKRRLPTAQVYQTTDQIEDTFGYYHKVARDEGWEATPDHFILCRHIYIDESAEKAREIAEPAMRYFFTVFNRGFNEAINKGAADQRRLMAALTTERSFNYFREGNRERLDFSKLDWDGLIRTGYLIAGNPDTVAAQINAQMKQIGANHFMGMFHIGNLPHKNVISSLNLFRKEVMPRLQ